jgi:hypothetical protein
VADPEAIDERDAIVVDQTSVDYARATLEHTGLSQTNSNLFCLIWVCVQTLCARGMPLELILSMMQDAKDATPMAQLDPPEEPA